MRRRLRKLEMTETEAAPVCDSHGNPFQKCMICLEQFGACSLRGRLPCGHDQFCYTCIETWSCSTNKCPLCATRFNLLQKVTVSEEREVAVISQVNVDERNLEEEIDEELLRMLEQVRCQICGLDHDEHTLLLCDYCDDGYHTACLGMDCIPHLDQWYCDQCLPRMDKKEVEQQWKQMEQVGRRRYSRPVRGRAPPQVEVRRKRLRKLANS
jgi:hypothetical protein